MPIYIIIQVIYWIARILSILVIVHVVLTYFMSPYHPVRMFIDRIVEPMLMPIRRLIPSFQSIDLSPLILLIIIQLLQILLINLVRVIG
jgi:YggT family protein